MLLWWQLRAEVWPAVMFPKVLVAVASSEVMVIATLTVYCLLNSVSMP